MKLFERNLEKGNRIEKFLSEYFEEIFRWRFVGGNIDGEIINQEEIERVFSCKYIPPKRMIHGHLIEINGKRYTMPDLLFASKRGIYFWTESKSSYNERTTGIDIEKSKVDSYFSLHEDTHSPVWVVVTVITMEFYIIYSARINELVDTARISFFNENFGKECYRFDINEYPFTKIAQVRIDEAQ